jgi:hypothetical protein
MGDKGVSHVRKDLGPAVRVNNLGGYLQGLTGHLGGLVSQTGGVELAGQLSKRCGQGGKHLGLPSKVGVGDHSNGVCSPVSGSHGGEDACEVYQRRGEPLVCVAGCVRPRLSWLTGRSKLADDVLQGPDLLVSVNDASGGLGCAPDGAFSLV